jgi:hypothetical protein
VLTTDQLCALGFGSIVTARHRLGVLAAIGVLRRFRPHPETGSAPWHYLLGPVGAALLGAEDRDEKKWAPQVRADRQLALERSQRLSHMTSRNWFFVALAAYARTGGGELREWLNETQAASRYHAQVYVRPDDWDRLPNPDGLGTWAEAGREVTFLLEYDTGTENLPRLTGKLDGYAILAGALASADIACPPLLFCLPGPRREQSARRALAWHPDAGKLRIATAALDPRATCPAGPVWLPLGEASGPVRLIDLAALLPDPWQGYPRRAGTPAPRGHRRRTRPAAGSRLGRAQRRPACRTGRRPGLQTVTAVFRVSAGVPAGVLETPAETPPPRWPQPQVRPHIKQTASGPGSWLHHDFPTRSTLRRGGERPTARSARPARRTARPAATHGKARQRDRCAKDAATSDDDLDAYVKEVVDTLPPLTDDQRDLLALIFRSRHGTK